MERGGRLRIGTVCEKRARRGGIPGADPPTDALRISAMCEQQRDDLGAAVATRSERERRDASGVGRVRIRAGVEQGAGLDDIVDGPVQCGDAGIVRVFRIGVLREHARDQIRIAVPDREHQRAVAIRIFGVRIGAAIEQHARVRQIAVIDRDHELGQPTAGAQREAQQRSSQHA